MRTNWISSPADAYCSIYKHICIFVSLKWWPAAIRIKHSKSCSHTTQQSLSVFQLHNLPFKRRTECYNIEMWKPLKNMLTSHNHSENCGNDDEFPALKSSIMRNALRDNITSNKRLRPTRTKTLCRIYLKIPEFVHCFVQMAAFELQHHLAPAASHLHVQSTVLFVFRRTICTHEKIT